MGKLETALAQVCVDPMVYDSVQLITQLAAAAPETIPDWFEHYNPEPEPQTTFAPSEIENHEARHEWEKDDKIARYFQWRVFYSRVMLEHLFLPQTPNPTEGNEDHENTAG